MNSTNSKTQHTPGDWVMIQDQFVGEPLKLSVSSERGRICTLARYNVKGRGLEHDLDMVKANARLIAAAPQLLTACQQALKFFQAGLNAAGFNPTVKEERETALTIQTELAKLRTAIAKAEGRS